VKKKPPLAVIAEVKSSVQGDSAIEFDGLVVTGGGMRLQSKYERVKPSRRDKGSSVFADMAGTLGR